jgi:peptidoglycan glycosyltransferase
MIGRLRGPKKTGKTPSGRFYTPKKGTIRVVLLFAALLAAYKIAGSLLASSGDSTLTARSDSLCVPGIQKTEKSPESPSAVNVRIGTSCSAGDLSLLLAAAPPRLTAPADTMVLGNDSLVRWYSVDTTLQKLVAGLFKQYHPLYGVAVIIQPESGRVLALVTHLNDSARSLGDHLCLRSFLPAASIFKTVTAAAAIETARYSDSTMLPVTGRNHTLYRSQIKAEITPWNEVTFAEAYCQSINPVFARIGMHVLGQKVLQKYGERFGFNTAIPFDMPVDSSRAVIPFDTTYAMAEVASGFNRKTSLSALHGALIAAAAVNGGIMPQPTLVDSVVRTGGKRLYTARPRPWKTAVTGSTAEGLRGIMGQVVKQGTARKSFRMLNQSVWSKAIECGGKTGSINVDTLGKIDWFIGYAVDLVNPESSLALAVATVHGPFWTVHSAYIAAEIIRKTFRPVRNTLSTRDLTIPVNIDSPSIAKTPEG